MAGRSRRGQIGTSMNTIQRSGEARRRDLEDMRKMNYPTKAEKEREYQRLLWLGHTEKAEEYKRKTLTRESFEYRIQKRRAGR